MGAGIGQTRSPDRLEMAIDKFFKKRKLEKSFTFNFTTSNLDAVKGVITKVPEDLRHNLVIFYGEQIRGPSKKEFFTSYDQIEELADDYRFVGVYYEKNPLKRALINIVNSPQYVRNVFK